MVKKILPHTLDRDLAPRSELRKFASEQQTIEPVVAFRVTLPDGTQQLVEPPSCRHCLPRVIEIPRTRSRCLIVWDCRGGCGYFPPDEGGGPIGGGS